MKGNEQPQKRSGYGKPPAPSRFKKGQSGNPRGRPPGRRKGIPYETILGQMVTVRENGLERRVTTAEAFLLDLVQKAIAGDMGAAKLATEALERRRPEGGQPISSRIKLIRRIILSDNAVNKALELLRMGKILDRNRDSIRMAVEPWVVEAALERLGNKRFTLDEQRTIVRATRTPWKVRWPRWWEVMP